MPRQHRNGFDTLGYLAANLDVAAANVNPLDHYLQYGIHEGLLHLHARGAHGD